MLTITGVEGNGILVYISKEIKMPQYDDSVQQIEYARERKLSKLAVLSFLIMLGGFWGFYSGNLKSLTMWLPAVALGAYSLMRIREHSGDLTGKFFGIMAVFVPLICILAGCMLIFFWHFDADPIENDLSVSDLYQVDESFAGSFELLRSLGDTDTKVMVGVGGQINRGNIDDVRVWLGANKSSILSDWEKTSEAREVIESLDGFSEIADMTEPDAANALGVFNDFMYLSELYSGYACLQNQLGSGLKGVGQFVKFDSVLKKIRANARSSVIGEMCDVGLSHNVIAANYIANYSGTDVKTLEVLASHFKRLPNDYASLRNGVVFDYLQSKEAIHQAVSGEPSGFMKAKWLLKPNSLCRVYRNYCDNGLAVLGVSDAGDVQELSVWPSFYPKKISGITVDADMEVPALYRYYNPYGSVVIDEMRGSFGKRLVADINYKVLNDLLVIALNKRLGKAVSLKARAYSEEYVIDAENKMIFSPGPDGEQFTQDDIKLFVEPAVLKL